MSLISNLNNKNEDLIELNKESFKNSFNFNIPKNTFIDDNLFNKKKISDDVISMSVNFVAQEPTATKGDGGEVTVFAAK